MKYASTTIINGTETVVEVLELSQLPDFNQTSPPAGTHVVDDNVLKGWVHNGTIFIEPLKLIKTLDQSKTAKNEELARYRYKKETSGLNVAGAQIKTDRESQAQLNSALTSLQSGLIPDTPWKAANGWAVVTLTEIQPIAQAVAQHVRSCFVQEKIHSDFIDAITAIEALDEYDITTGWY